MENDLWCPDGELDSFQDTTISRRSNMFVKGFLRFPLFCVQDVRGRMVPFFYAGTEMVCRELQTRLDAAQQFHCFFSMLNRDE